MRREMLSSGVAERNSADDLSDDPDRLVELVNQCFWASIQLEEGRAMKGTVCICSQDQVIPLSRAFKPALALSVKNLVSVLTACPGSFLAAQASAEGVEIWGILDAGAAPLLATKLRIAGAGLLIASNNDRVLAVIEGGEAHIPVQLGGGDWVTLVANALDQAKPFPDRFKHAFLLQQVVIAIHRQGHGGALVVGPSSTTGWTDDVNLAFEFDEVGSHAIGQRIAELEVAVKQKQEHLFGDLSGAHSPPSLLPPPATVVAANRSLLESLLRQFGELSAIDGAVVVNEELRILGFGAKLMPRADDFEVHQINVLTGESNGISYKALGGTRHQSAACFVRKHPEAMVFVASQDGRLTLFVWVTDRAQVAAVRQLEYFVLK